MLKPYGHGLLDPRIRSVTLENVNGLTMHFLESGHDVTGRPLVVLLHGFPEIAYSWRNVIMPLANAGYHVIAPDMRGYGRTTGWDKSYDADLSLFRPPNMCRDIIALVSAIGYRSVACVAGHDAGSPIAAWLSLTRPDMFRACVMMSAPAMGAPALSQTPARMSMDQLDAELASLPHPRKHYQRYNTLPHVADEIMNCPQSLHAFFRAYFHYKSADWKGNKPFPLKAVSAEEMAKMPTYYVMERDKGWPETVAAQMPSASEIAACKWLTEGDLDVYAAEYSRTGVQGGLNTYRAFNHNDPKSLSEMLTFSGRTIDVPSCFIGGACDWGLYQTPGAMENMRDKVCTRLHGIHVVEGAGHWVQQEQSDQVAALLLTFINEQAPQS